MKRLLLGFVIAAAAAACGDSAEPTAAAAGDARFGVTAFAPPAGPASPPGNPVAGSGWELIRQQIFVPAQTQAPALVQCPPGKKAVAGGSVNVIEGVEYLGMAGIVSASGDAGGVMAWGGDNGNSVQAFVICVIA